MKITHHLVYSCLRRSKHNSKEFHILNQIIINLNEEFKHLGKVSFELYDIKLIVDEPIDLISKMPFADPSLSTDPFEKAVHDVFLDVYRLYAFAGRDLLSTNSLMLLLLIHYCDDEELKAVNLTREEIANILFENHKHNYKDNFDDFMEGKIQLENLNCVKTKILGKEFIMPAIYLQHIDKNINLDQVVFEPSKRVKYVDMPTIDLKLNEFQQKFIWNNRIPEFILHHQVQQLDGIDSFLLEIIIDD